MARPTRPSSGLSASALGAPGRIVAGTLVAVSRTSLPAIAAGILLATEPVTLGVLVKALVLLTGLPGLAAWLFERVNAAGVAVLAGQLIVDGRRVRVEVPCASIERVLPWKLPLPGPGLSLGLRSGRRLATRLMADDPTPLLSALADAGGVDAARAAIGHPTVVYARARHAIARRRWPHALGKFVGFALVPTAIMFNAHQHIAYGALLGQYYLEGLGPYLRTFAVYWALTAIYLLLYASVWRGVAEGVALLTAWVAPSHAARVRRAVELVCSVVYYVGVPTIVLIPFLR